MLPVLLLNDATEPALRYGRAVRHNHLLIYLALPLLIVAGSVALGALLRAVAPRIY